MRHVQYFNIQSCTVAVVFKIKGFLNLIPSYNIIPTTLAVHLFVVLPASRGDGNTLICHNASTPLRFTFVNLYASSLIWLHVTNMFAIVRCVEYVPVELVRLPVCWFQCLLQHFRGSRDPDSRVHAVIWRNFQSLFYSAPMVRFSLGAGALDRMPRNDLSVSRRAFCACPLKSINLQDWPYAS